MAVLFFKPIFKERIWGSHYFKEKLKYTLDDNLYGEFWSLSAVNNDESIIAGGNYDGMNLSELYHTHPELFNSHCVEFPLLIKLLSTNDKLSVQVHPDDDYAKKVENCYGKTECWYFLNTEQDASIIFGHHAKSKEEILNALKNNNLEDLLDFKNVKDNDFAFIKSKTVHGLGKGLLLLEVQQSSDITYRLYDYNRKDKNGNLRPLHIEKGLDVLDYNDSPNKIINYSNVNTEFTTLTSCEYFDVLLWNVTNKATYINKDNKFKIFTVCNGEFDINEKTLHMGESFLSTADEKEITVTGTGKLLISYSNK